MTKEGASVVEPYLKKHGVKYPVFQDVDGQLHQQFEVRGIPQAFLVDEDNVIVWSGHPASPQLHQAVTDRL